MIFIPLRNRWYCRLDELGRAVTTAIDLPSTLSASPPPAACHCAVPALAYPSICPDEPPLGMWMLPAVVGVAVNRVCINPRDVNNRLVSRV